MTEKKIEEEVKINRENRRKNAIEILNKINNIDNFIKEFSREDNSMLVRIHGWDNKEINEIIALIYSDKYPTRFIDINKINKHINMINQLNINFNDFLKLKNLLSEKDIKKSKAFITDIAISFSSVF